MTYTNIESNLNIVIHEGGLNTIYDEYKNKFVLFNNLLSSIIEFNYNSEDDSVLKDKENQINSSNSLDMNQVMRSFSDQYKNINSIIFNPQELREFYLKFNTHINEIFANRERKSKTDLFINLNNFESAGNDVLSKYEGRNIVLLHYDLISLLTDYIVLKNLNLEDKFMFIYNNKTDIQSDFMQLLFKAPKNFILYSRNLETLFEFKNYGVWSVYLTNYVYSSEHKIKNIESNGIQSSKTNYTLSNLEYMNSITEFNKDFIRSKGRFFDFAHISFNCSFNYLRFIEQINLKNQDLKANSVKLYEEINQTNPIRVFILAKSLFKFREFQRSIEYYVCDESIIYNFYCGFEQIEELHLNGEFDIIFFKITRPGEVEFCANLIKTTLEIIKRNPRIYLANPVDNLDIFNDRGKMVICLNQITEKSRNLTEEFNTGLIVPESILINLQLINSKEKFRNFLQENKLSLPLILKIDGPKTNIPDHNMCTIIADIGIDNFLDYIIKLAAGIEDKVNILIQSFFNHGGKVIKSYYINKTAYHYVRTSLPDMLEEYTSTIKEFENGYFCFTTPDLVSKNFEELMKKFHVDSEIDKKIDCNFLKSVCDVFEKETQKTLFGLDFLYNSRENIYSLIDCNYFPGYKELKSSFGNIIKEHLLKYYRDHINKLDGKK